jgi:RimJ/RimL family protein N-acetyltransferase
MIELVPFKPEHMANIKKEDIDAKILVFINDLDQRAEYYAQAGPCFTMLLDGAVMAIGGVIQFWQGSGEAWMMVSPEGRRKGLSLYKHMSLFLDTCFNKYGFHRIQACIVNEHKEAHKCAFRLGFIPEGMMIHYGPNKENYVRYVRFPVRS